MAVEPIASPRYGTDMAYPYPASVLFGIVVILACALPQESVSLTVKASAYNSTEAQTDGDPNEGAWGDRIVPGMKVVAVSPDLLEAGLVRGTEVRIEGLDGKWTVLDRTASRHRNRIDVYMGDDIEAAIDWGIRDVTIEVFGVDLAP